MRRINNLALLACIGSIMMVLTTDRVIVGLFGSVCIWVSTGIFLATLKERN